jgi:CubicO group peptidase (beta-lactamase class C family)
MMRALSALLVLTPVLCADERTDKVDKIFAAYDKPGSPGCALGVVSGGKLIYSRGYGLANLEYGVPLSAQSVFDIASTSKQFVAMAALLLEQEGRISLEDPVRKWIPELPDYGKPLTIRNMLEHTGGLRDYLTLGRLKGLRPADYSSETDALHWLVRQKELNFAPGSDWLYSNSGYFLISQVVNRAAGKTLREYAHERIFAPLGMKNTHFHDDHTEIVPNRAAGYAPAPGRFRISMSLLDMVGDGGLYTNVEDLARWDENFYSAKVGGPPLIRRLQQPAKLDTGKPLDYALGLMIDKWNGRRLVSHGGNWAGYRAELIRLPDERFSVICLCNVVTADAAALARSVAEIWFPPPPQRATQAEPIVLSEEQLRKWQGDWREEMSGTIWKLAVKDGKLGGQHPNGPVRLVPLGDREFKVEGPPLPARIVFDDRTARLVMGNFPSINLIRVREVALKRAELEALSGKYWSDELEVHYVLAADNGKLTLRAPRQSPLPLIPADIDLFAGRGLELKFERDAAGKITGFRLGAGRVRNLLFVKSS